METVRGPHGGYRLRPGPRIPPLLLTEEEAVALALAFGALTHLGMALAPETLTGLRAKLERTRPPGPMMVPADGALLTALGEAASAGRRLRLRYRAEGGEETTRLVDPYGVARWSRARYLVAHCHLRVGVRLFRLDRIAAAEATDTMFVPPADFDPYAHVARAMAAYPGRWAVDVRLALPLAAARDSVIAPYGTLTADGAGSRFQGRFDNLDGLARELVSLRCRFSVSEPPELRAALRQLATEIAALTDRG